MYAYQGSRSWIAVVLKNANLRFGIGGIQEAGERRGHPLNSGPSTLIRCPGRIKQHPDFIVAHGSPAAH